MVTRVIGRELASRRPSAHNACMDSSGAISAAVAGLGAGGNQASVAMAVLRQTEASQAQQVATLFNSIGLGNSISAFA
jgi:hypothetical protein